MKMHFLKINVLSSGKVKCDVSADIGTLICSYDTGRAALSQIKLREAAAPCSYSPETCTTGRLQTISVCFLSLPVSQVQAASK